MARLNYTVQQINAALAKAIAAANTGSLSNLTTADKSSLVSAINEVNTLAGNPFGNDVSIGGAIATFKRNRSGMPVDVIANILPKQAGSGDPSPSNIRTISGWSSVNVFNTGKNLWNPTYFTDNSFTLQTDGSLKGASENISGKTLSIPPTSRAVMSLDYYGASGRAGYFQFVYSDGTVQYPIECNSTTWTHLSAVSALDKTVIGITFLKSNNRDMYVKNFQLELGSTATSYEPYTGNTYTLQLGNTYYGGTVDFVSGKMTVTHGYAVFNGSENWVNVGGSYPQAFQLDTGITNAYQPNPATQDDMSNLYPWCKTSSTNYGCRWQAANSNGRFYVYDDNYSSNLQDFKSHLGTTNLQICYKLATPIEIDLTPTQISSLIGENNIWADSGDVEVSFPADFATLDAIGKLDPSQATAPIKEYSSAHTITKDDYSCLLLVTGATTITIPTGLDIGTEIEVMRTGTSTVTISPASGVTLNGASSNKTITTAYNSLKLKCIGNNAWVSR
jgi:hypothetical protein